MLPRLQAEERLNAINDRAVAFGGDRDQARTTFDKLERDALVQRPRPARANAAALAGMGIGVSGPAPAAERVLSDG